jgi:hypothetical protein
MAEPQKRFYLPTTRVHCTEAYRWGQSAATDYWLVNNSAFDTYAAAATTVGEQVAENGWTATSLANTAGSASDFRGGVFTKTTNPGPKTGSHGGTFADAGTPNHVLTNASGDLLGSPAIFGDAAHMRMAAQLAGKSSLPNYLIGDFWAAFTVASADEVTSAIGFFEDGATISTEADQYAVVKSNGTNFQLAGNASTMTTGALVDNAWHVWKIVLQFNGATGPNVWWYIDGSLQSTTAGVGAQDEFPLKWGLHSLTTNRQGLGLTHVYYDW